MKHVPRFYVNSSLSVNSEIILSREQMHHAHVVLRLSCDDEVRVFNGRDGEWGCKITDVKKNAIVCSEQIRPQTTEKGVIVACALINPNHFSILIEKITELGVVEIIPVITRYTQYRKINDKKIEQIMIHACEQSKRLSIPRLYEPVKLEDFLKQDHANLKILVGDESLTSCSLLDSISEDAIFLVGPEGGFSENEYNLFRQYDHVKLFSLGQNVLRSETAAISFVAVWNSMFCKMD